MMMMQLRSTRRRRSFGRRFLVLLKVIYLMLLLWGSDKMSTTINVNAFYVSYEKARSYAAGERIPILANKLTSSDMLTSMDYAHLELCSSSISSSSPGDDDEAAQVLQPFEWNHNAWKRAMGSLHGDSLYVLPPSSFELRMKQNLYCRQLCATTTNLNEDNSDNNHNNYAQAITQGMQYNFLVDGMPVAYRQESVHRISIRYWGGIPVGRRGNTNSKEEQDQEEQDDYVYFGEENDDPRFRHSTHQDLFIYNHFNFEITYWQVPNTDQYRVVRTQIQPFSMAHDYSFTSVPPPSCISHKVRTEYDSLNGTAPQQLLLVQQQLGGNNNSSSNGNNNNNNNRILFTYDVLWIEYKSPHDPWTTRWNVFLSMDNQIPTEVQWFGLLVAVLINFLLVLALGTWLMRDLSYKPVSVMISSSRVVENVDNDDALTINGDVSVEVEQQDEEVREDQVQEMKLWPLSTRLFFPPRYLPVGFCMGSGMGAQLLLCSFVFVLLFRTGIINESLGADALTAAVVLYTLSGFVGGLVTARLYGIFHHTNKVRARAMLACLGLATFFPLLGLLVMHLTYDVLQPELAPDYQVVSASAPMLIGIWLLGIVPLTMFGGWVGFRISGPMHNFPVSEGNKGYQDLALQDNEEDHDNNNIGCCWKNSRTIALFFLAGIPPVACSFVEYAYGVAGPIYTGYFSDSSFFAIFSFLFFCTCIALVAALFFYQQIRSQNYDWWWASFVVGASSGFYVFLLSISWILYDAPNSHSIPGVSIASYLLWFAFGSLAVTFLAGFVSLSGCILLTRLLYSFLTTRQGGGGGGDDNSSGSDGHYDDEETEEDNHTSMESSESSTAGLRTDTSSNRGSYNMQSLIDRS